MLEQCHAKKLVINVDRKCIERLRIKYNQTGDVADLQRPDAPDSFIVTIHHTREIGSNV